MPSMQQRAIHSSAIALHLGEAGVCALGGAKRPGQSPFMTYQQPYQQPGDEDVGRRSNT
jgi:hypothetical protein